jgi:hypothetical protein
MQLVSIDSIQLAGVVGGDMTTVIHDNGTPECKRAIAKLDALSPKASDKLAVAHALVNCGGYWRTSK